MKKTIFKYLEFSLPIHNCVIVPELGGFLINIEASYTHIDNKIAPPICNIVFNPELKHNDGILASYIIKDENISYNAACIKIKEFVKTLKSDLKAGKTIACGNLGTFKYDSIGNFIFTPIQYSHPTLLGLCPIQIQQLSDINRKQKTKRKNLSLKYTISGIAATAAAFFLFAIPSTSIKDNSNSHITQNAGFISSITISLANSKKSEIKNISIEKAKETTPIDTIVKEYSLKENIASPTRTYYIIIGGEDSKERATMLLNKIKSTTFPTAAIVETTDRYRIYVSSFNDKIQAETFLDGFRKENPKYETAWLYSKRN